MTVVAPDPFTQINREDKTAFRQAARARRGSLSPQERAEAGRLLSEQLCALDFIRNARVISGYVPFGGEINILTFVQDMLLDPTALLEKVAMPRVEEPDKLHLHLCDPSLFCDPLGGGHAFVEGYGGILEPPATWEEVPFEEVDTLIVPGVAFDRTGRRLGYGKGFYDRLLAHRNPQATVVGVVFDELLFDEIPHEEHDMPMDYVVTPHEVITH